MLAWLKDVVKLFGRIIKELIAIKTIVFVVISVIYSQNADRFGITGFVTFSVIAMSFVSVRYAEKRLELLKKLKE